MSTGSTTQVAASDHHPAVLNLANPTQTTRWSRRLLPEDISCRN